MTKVVVKLRGDNSDVMVDNQKTCLILNELTDKKIQTTFNCDRIWSNEPSSEFYTESCKPVIDSALRGYNGIIMCYGYSASGKTYTIFGDDSEQNGILQVMGNDLFSTPDIVIKLACFEIYREKLRDLINGSNTSAVIDSTGLCNKSFLTVKSLDSFLQIVQHVRKNRVTTSTTANQVSSRSHCIINLQITTESTIADLFIVDLAGCERYIDTHSVDQPDVLKSFKLTQRSNGIGDQFEKNSQGDSKSINTSILAINKVVYSISENKQFINYRDSKITMALKPGFEGRSNLVIILCCNLSKLQEVVTTLRFGSRCAAIPNLVKKRELNCQNQLPLLPEKLIEENIKSIKENMEQADEQINSVNNFFIKTIMEKIEKIENDVSHLIKSHRAFENVQDDDSSNYNYTDSQYTTVLKSNFPDVYINNGDFDKKNELINASVNWSVEEMDNLNMVQNSFHNLRKKSNGSSQGNEPLEEDELSATADFNETALESDNLGDIVSNNISVILASISSSTSDTLKDSTVDNSSNTIGEITGEIPGDITSDNKSLSVVKILKKKKASWCCYKSTPV